MHANEGIKPLSLVFNDIPNKLKAIEYWKYSSFIKFLMPRSVKLNIWGHAKKRGSTPCHLSSRWHQARELFGWWKMPTKNIFIGLVSFSLTKTMLDITCWTSYEEMQISLPAYALFYIISLSFCKKLFNKQKNTINSKGPKR